tara:strand:- start:1649 stop:2104 length:456 start_codon:yes stop_codon:yes gene_type:complete
MQVTDKPFNKEDGEYNDICALRDKLLIKVKKLNPERAEELALFALNYLQSIPKNANFSNLPLAQQASKPIYCVVRHKSKSFLKKVISFYVISNERLINIDWFISEAVGYPYCEKHEGIIVKGGNTCLAWEVIYGISRLLYDEGYMYKREWI